MVESRSIDHERIVQLSEVKILLKSEDGRLLNHKIVLNDQTLSLVHP